MIPGLWIPSGANIKPVLNRPTELNGVAWTWPAADTSSGDVFTTSGAGVITLATAHPEDVTTANTTTTDAAQTLINATEALTDETVYAAKVTVLARCTVDGGGTASVGDVWSAMIDGTLKRTGGTLSLVNQSVRHSTSDQALASPIRLVANNTTKVLQVRVQGFASNTILWKVVCELFDVST